MTAGARDFLSEQLIAQLLESDLLLLESWQQAEKLQLDHVVAESATAQSLKSHIPNHSAPDSTLTDTSTDCDLAFELYISDARVTNDAAYAQMIQNETITVNTLDWQYAQRLASNERKFSFDAEFARRLQVIDDEGRQDIDQVLDADSLLGDISTSLDPNTSIKNFKHPSDFGASSHYNNEDVQTTFTMLAIDSGKTEAKGKGRELVPPNTPCYNTCGICMESFSLTHSPISASLSANSSNQLPFGLRLPCPKGHAYCIFCLTSYIRSKLDPDGNGVGRSSALVFPILCPECPSGEWPTGIDDDVAHRILGEYGIVDWHHQKLLESIPRLFCPNPRCSSLLEADENSEHPEAVCPSCQQLMCVRCRSRWHTGLSCETYQALPLDEKSPEDRQVLDLAKAEQWRRCPNCKVIVEHVSGCNHMICRCGFHFCFKCGCATTQEGKCKSEPPCELWDEEMLLEERERARNYRAAVPAPMDEHPPPRVAQVHRDDSLNWMEDPGVLCSAHVFTLVMVRTLTCGYCHTLLSSMVDLRYHLANVQRHSVYACCGQFYPSRLEFERHNAAQPDRFNYHSYQMVHARPQHP